MIYSIQYLRGIASVLVLLAHVSVKGQQYGQGVWGYWEVGQFGVDLFFVISGFIISLVIDRGEKAPKVFIWKRFLRIMPLYWTLTIMALVVYWIIPERVNVSGGFTDVLSSFLLLPSEGRLLIQNGWTLCYEMFFYGITAIMLYVLRGKWMLGVVLSIVACCFAGKILFTENHYFQFYTNNIILEFLWGVCLFFIWKKFRISSLIGSLMLLVGIAWLLADTGWSRAFAWGIPAVLIVGGLLSFEEMISSRKNFLGLAIGDSSYSLYLSHPFSLGAGAIFYERFITPSPLKEHLFLGALMVGSLVVGYLCYRYVEAPLLTRCKKLYV